jgi:NAD(P) transhydrogenase subunit beta
MVIAVLATVLGPEVSVSVIVIIIVCMLIGGTIGFILALKVQMTQMPELVAILHSLVGVAAVLVGFVNFMDPGAALQFSGTEKTIHEIEIYLGVLIGAITFSGSVIAFGKLSGKISGKPVLLPARHWMNLGLLIASIWLCFEFVVQAKTGGGMIPLLIMTAIALTFGVHMVMAIGGADMPVVISMLNSYSGWAAAATGFMLSNDLLIVTGALVGSSGAILSYIMCRAMNRNFIAVIAGGFGTESAGTAGTTSDLGEIFPIEHEEVADLLLDAKEVMIIPGYGMASGCRPHAWPHERPVGGSPRTL